MITIIAAIGENNELGKNNDLIWHLPDDFKRFKRITTGHPIIMGRKTFESFPKPLPNRKHIVITRQEDYNKPGCSVVHSLDQALEMVEGNQKAFIIGGGEIYKLGLPVADKMELTRVHGKFNADTYFPEIDFSLWKLKKEQYHEKDAKHNYAFTYLTYLKK
ncbi:dihydrofolate reductase [Haloflavibacter putidus]|uniref:Dihydrofolate reductase n=1 Tax=Haloflavibacter putidus TaxID=2576776 RepID=A0A508A1U1_9FLAO|nr:dihydrofolate reductase [Haloflavibacter putidus]TQD39792.1 dihydrofolate reductase [Haloflavibacter putidus]